MSLRLFGFELTRKKEIEQEIQNLTFTSDVNEDGALAVTAASSAGFYIDLAGQVQNESQLITKYREMSLFPEVDSAIDEIVNESISTNEENDVIKIILDDLSEEIPPKICEIIENEFKEVLNILEFNKKGQELFRLWYVDGRLRFHVAVDEQNPENGIIELFYIDPRKIKKIIEILPKKMNNQDVMNAGPFSTIVSKIQNKYYIYNEKGFDSQTKNDSSLSNNNDQVTGLRIAEDSIIDITSGLTSADGKTVLSYLDKAAKPLNQLKTLEDATVIYRLVRAPERRVWTVDVGELPKAKAEQEVRNLQTQCKNKLGYNAADGTIIDSRKFMTMMEDYWITTRGDKGVKVDTLPSGELTGVLDDVLYFQKKLYSSLNVPVGRLQQDGIFSIGRSGEITRDEIKFAKFIFNLRIKFSELFLNILEKQLILKNIMPYEEWRVIRGKIKFDYVKDNSYSELSDLAVLRERFETVATIDPFIGKYISVNWICKHILKQTDLDREEINRDISQEIKSPLLHPELFMEPEETPQK